MDGSTGRRAVAFAFGPQHSWQRFTVYFLCADGAVCALCPIAPFGAALPASAAHNLAEAAANSTDLPHSPTTEAWIQQVRPHDIAGKPRMLSVNSSRAGLPVQ